jgi:hypothetical protein
MKTKDYKRAIEIIAERYEEARDEAFRETFEDFIQEYIVLDIHGKGNSFKIEDITKDDIQGFLDSWSFPSEYEWCEDKFNEERGAYEDAKYTAMKEEGII